MNAQQPLPDSTQVDLHLTLAHIGVIIQGLGELPAKFSINTINEVQQQIAAQLAPKDE